MQFCKHKLTGVLLLFLHVISVSQTLRFEQFTTKNGLLSDEVYTVHQDKKGYIWAFTNYGAIKYNSVEFKQVLKNLPFNESFIYSYYENKDGRKLVANSNAKIYEVINDSAFQVNGTDSVSEVLRDMVDEIGMLYVDDSLRIHAITKKQSYLFTPKKGRYKAEHLNKKIGSDSLVFEVKETGNILLPIANIQPQVSMELYGRSGKVYVFINTKKDPWIFEIDRNSTFAPKTFKKFNDKIYFGYSDRLGIIQNKTLKYISLNAYILNYTKDRNGHLWVACYNGGLYELNEKDSVIHHYFDNITINHVLIDSQNGLWASSTGHGLFHCINLNNLSFDESGFLSGTINILKKAGNELFVADAHGDIYKVINGQFTRIKECDQIVIPTDIIKSGEDYIISSSFNVDQIKLHEKYFESLARKHILIYSGFKLLAYTKDSVFYLYRRGLGLAIKGKFNKRIEFVRKTYDVALRKRIFIVATEKGVYGYMPEFSPQPYTDVRTLPIVHDSLRELPLLAALKDSPVRKMVTDSLGNLWFCTLGSGIFLLDQQDHLRHYTEENGLPATIINAVSFDNGRVLLSTNKGLFYGDSKNAFERPGQWKNIYTGNVQNAVFFENKVYVSTFNGLVILNDIELKKNIHFNLDAISVNSNRISYDQLKFLKFYQNNLEFKFDLVDFTSNGFKIKYTLDGPYHDNNIIDGGTINFQNLAPGDYAFTATPDISNGHKLKITLHFSIIPAFWQTTTFIVFICFVCGALFVYIASLLFKNYKKRQDKKITAEKLILEYKLIALKAQINPHFVSNCLSAIQHLIIQGKSHAAADYIAKFGFLVRQILNFSTRSLVSLKEELQIAKLNIDLEQLRFENKFTYQLEVDPTIDLEKIYVPALILNPIIENSIWHGLLPLKNKRQGYLLIKVEQRNNMLFLILEDNGIGRKPAQENMSNLRESKGIKLTQQRLININYLYNIELSEISYEDLKDEEGNAMGTRVTISLPTHLIPVINE